MRALLALALTAAMGPLGAMAHELDAVPSDGVVQVDEATVHEQVIAAQLACRDHAYGARPATPAAPRTPPRAGSPSA